MMMMRRRRGMEDEQDLLQQRRRRPQPPSTIVAIGDSAAEIMAADAASPPCATAAMPLSSPLSLATIATKNATKSTGSNNSNKRQRRPAGTPDPDAEVVALSPHTLMESDRYVCDICSQGFQRDQNLQMHRRRHKVPWKLLKRPTADTSKRVYVCPEPTCLHHNPGHALGDLVGIKKHFRRKHSAEKQWKCERCSKGYAVQSDYKAHLKTCGTRGHCCDCGRVFSRVESFIEHQDTCSSAKEKSALQGVGCFGSRGNNYANKMLDSPSSHSTDAAASVNPSQSAMSEGGIRSFDKESTPQQPSDQEYPATSASPTSKQHWSTILDGRELQLLPSKLSLLPNAHESLSDALGTITMFGAEVDAGRRNSFSIVNLENSRGSSLPSRLAAGDDVTPQLQLSIGPYSASARAPTSSDVVERHSTFVSEGKLTADKDGRCERSSCKKVHQRMLRSVGSDVSTSSASPSSAMNLSQRCSNRSSSGDGRIGDGLRLSSSSPGSGSDSMRDASEVHPGNSNPSMQLQSLTDEKARNSKPCLLERKRMSPAPEDTATDVMVSEEEHGARMQQSPRVGGRLGMEPPTMETMGWMHNAVLNPIAPCSKKGSHHTSSGSSYPSDLVDSSALMRRLASRDQMETAVRAMEGVSRHNELAKGSAWSSLAAARRTLQQEREETNSDLAQAHLLKHEAQEQLKLASAEKVYAEHAHESAKRQRELAEADLACAKRVREHAQSELAKAHLLKEHAERCMSTASARFSSLVAASSPIQSSISPPAASQPTREFCLPLASFQHHLHHRVFNNTSTSSPDLLLRLPKSEII